MAFTGLFSRFAAARPRLTADQALAKKPKQAGAQIGRHKRWEGENNGSRVSADAVVPAYLFRFSRKSRQREGGLRAAPG